jgi:hypothetical protein
MNLKSKQRGNSLAGLIISGVVVLLGVILTFAMFGKNDNGYRTVVQYPSGYTFVQLEPDWYLTWFGTETVYNDVITVDFDQGPNPSRPTIDLDGIDVRYQDGGLGTIHGIARFDLPDTPEEMLKIHKEFVGNSGVANKLLRNVTEEAMNLTAGLMASEDAYAVKRGDFAQWSRDQVENGKYRTKLTTISEEDVTGKRVVRQVPEILYGEDGNPVQTEADLRHYAIRVSGFQITDWGFEPKTLQQITEKREATMAIITAKANADRAVQDTITAAEQGKANVMKAKYEQEVLKEKAVVIANREKEVAVIAATRKVEVAEQHKLEAEQKKLAAVQYKQEQVLRGEGDGAYKRLVMQADGALKQKLDAWVQVNAKYATEFGKQKWVPEVQMGGGGERGGSSAEDLINLLVTRTASDLALDTKVKAK